jgi:predicted oxidoreductase
MCPRIRLTESGPEVSRVVAGMWRMAEWGMGVRERQDFIRACLDMGVSTFDHADLYGGGEVETLFGQALAAEPALKARIQVITKCGIRLAQGGLVKHYDLGRAHIVGSVNQSLSRLRLDTLDVLLLHRPSPMMDFDEIAETLAQLRAAGKVQHFGVSNFSATQHQALHSRIPLVTNQIELSPLHLNALEDGTMDALQHLSTPPMLWSPLAGGQLFESQHPRARAVMDVAAGLADATGLSPTGVIYAWLMQLPGRPVPITGSRRLAAIQEAVAAAQVKLPLTSWFALLEAARGQEVA